MLEGEQEMVACDERQGEEDEEEEYGESADESQHRPPSRDWEGRGAVVVKGLPRETSFGALKQYFSQFGDVTRIRMVRSKVTGGFTRMASVEFQFQEVAEIVAKTTHGQMADSQSVLRTVFVPSENRPWRLFRGKQVPPNHGHEVKKAFIRRIGKPVGKEKSTRVGTLNAKLEKAEKKKQKLAALGVSYEEPAIVHPELPGAPPAKTARVDPTEHSAGAVDASEDAGPTPAKASDGKPAKRRRKSS
mmetsp:Transcript_35732/g.78044  ORF Transcript_35732/g.78044 Transcript_35732/m.78044 type:complete len:246 (+) Transcript_35732:79-816(+)